jgi:hypothetical protein
VDIHTNIIGRKKRMGKLNIKVRKEIDEKFREEVFKRKGMKKGNLTEAVEEAMLLWVNVLETEKDEQKVHKR